MNEDAYLNLVLDAVVANEGNVYGTLSAFLFTSLPLLCTMIISFEMTLFIICMLIINGTSLSLSHD